ncbi:MAG: bifunctional precorrin-2 dehydrogenase/sirohydrochlorin ferrochelatase [Thermoleophilia bacterium]
MSRLYPIYVDVGGRTCCVVGGGPIAEGRARTLAEHGAHVRLVAPDLTPGLEDMLAQNAIHDYRQRRYEAHDVTGCTLVVAATDDRAVNLAVRDDARAAGALCNVADDPSACDFQVPALVRRGDLTFAVTTGGASPVVAAAVRRRLEGVFGPEWGDLLELLSEFRPAMKRRYPDTAARSAAVRDLLEGDLLDLLAAGDRDAARALVAAAAGEGA